MDMVAVICESKVFLIANKYILNNSIFKYIETDITKPTKDMLVLSCIIMCSSVNLCWSVEFCKYKYIIIFSRDRCNLVSGMM